MRKSRCPWIHNHARWTAAEEDYLRANRATMTAKAMAAALLGRTRDAVQSRCNQLCLYRFGARQPGTKRRLIRYSADEIATLERHAGRLPPYMICYLFLPDRTPDTIYQKIKNLGLPMWPGQRAAPASAHLQVAA